MPAPAVPVIPVATAWPLARRRAGAEVPRGGGTPERRGCARPRPAELRGCPWCSVPGGGAAGGGGGGRAAVGAHAGGADGGEAFAGGSAAVSSGASGGGGGWQAPHGHEGVGEQAAVLRGRDGVEHGVLRVFRCAGG